jgi:hypothetical protein
MWAVADDDIRPPAVRTDAEPTDAEPTDTGQKRRAGDLVSTHGATDAPVSGADGRAEADER